MTDFAVGASTAKSAPWAWRGRRQSAAVSLSPMVSAG